MASNAVRQKFRSGKRRRDDLANACLSLMQKYSDEKPINVGWREDVSIAELAALVAKTVGFAGSLRFNTSMPDGTPRKLLDVSRATALGWTAKISLAEGLSITYEWFLKNRAKLRA